ncbi:MFS transporter, partial [Novosphingobium sp. 1949]|nr:MFS transporter [Novosphingobium organovorum]
VALAVVLPGLGGAAALLGVGLCNSVMFPLAYTLALPADERDVPVAAMLLCMAVVGGAIVPLATGLLADMAGLRPALLLPGLCYGVVFAFAFAHGLRQRTFA